MRYFSLAARMPEASAVEPKALTALYALITNVPFVRTMHRRFVAGVLAQGIEGGVGLDLGTGPGIVAMDIARQRPGLRMVGIDLAAHMVKRAHRQVSPAEGNNLKLWPQADGHSLPFADRSIDLVVSSFALHHWADPLRILNEIARVLRPGGRYYIADLCREPSLFQRLFAYSSIPVISLLFGSYWGYGGYYESVRASYSRAEAREMLASSNLPPGEVGYDSTWVVPILTMASRVQT